MFPWLSIVQISSKGPLAPASSHCSGDVIEEVKKVFHFMVRMIIDRCI